MSACKLGFVFLVTALACAAEDKCEATLVDSTGAALAGSVVILDQTNRLTSDAAGKFSFSSAADYQVSVNSNGKTFLAASVLHLSCTGSVLQLSAGTVILQPQKTATGGEQLSSKAVSSLPLNKRDFSQLLLLAAGTMTDTNGAANFTQQFAINGQRGTAAVFAMDGADSTDPEIGGATFTNLNVDAVQEIRSSSGWMPAEIGRGAAGFTDVITRSGANAFHGSAFEFLRNSALDARNFFDYRSAAEPRRIPPFQRNEFGLTNGGRLIKNRTFYFVEYQGFRQVLSATVIIPVPTLAERRGFDTTAFAGDTLIIPVNPAMEKLLNRYPLPNNPTGPYGARTYATSSKVTTISDQFSSRLDHKLTSKSQLFARFTMENTKGPITNPTQTAIDPNFAVNFVDQQRNAVLNFTHTSSANAVAESSISYTRATPLFPTTDRTDPSLTFGNGLYEAFNAAGGSVQGWFGNLMQARQGFTWIKGKHTIKTGAEVRLNRDSSIFGINPNGQFQFGGGTAYSPVAIASLSGAHDIAVGQALPDALSGLLTASAFSYNTAAAPALFPQGDRIGDAAIQRDAYNAYVQDSWKVSDRLLLNYGVRYEIEPPIRERNHQTSGPVLDSALPGSELLINPQPAYKTDKNGWGPRVSAEWNVSKNTLVRVGGGITTLLVNLFQDNLLTGSAPYAVYPRLTASPGQNIPFGLRITSANLPPVYDMSGNLIFASGNSKAVPANTLMDVNRFEQDLAALTGTSQITPISAVGIANNFKNGYISTWTAGLEHKLWGTTVDAAYVGTAANGLPAMDYPNAYPGADAAHSPYTQFNSTGAITGGYGQVILMTNRSHSTYHSLQMSVQKDLTASGLGFQASYSFSKSIDDTSAVAGGFIAGSSGAVAQTSPENPFDIRPDKGPSNFDIKNALSFSLFQDLHADKVPFLRRPLGKTLTAGWQLLGIGTLVSGLPFTVYSGEQQTGFGSIGADRPDALRTPVLSTSRAVREDYFGLGAQNTSYFSIPTGRFGTLGRNTFRGPGLTNFDMALIKDTPLAIRNGAERAALQFRAEFFNIFNIVNFGLPSNIVLGPGFGEISRTAGTSRQIQFSMKLIY